MRSIHLNTIIGTIAAAAALSAAPAAVRAQAAQTDPTARDNSDAADELRVMYNFRNGEDRLSWERARALARKSSGFRLIVSLQDHHLWAIIGRDTVLSAPAATAKGTTLEFGKKEWTFDTPRGM